MSQCPEADRLFDLAVAAAEAGDIADHVARCDSCGAELELMREVIGTLQPTDMPSAALVARTRAAVRGEAEARWELDRPRFADLTALGLLGALSVTGVVIWTDTSGQAAGTPLLIYSTIAGAGAALFEYVRSIAARPMAL